MSDPRIEIQAQTPPLTHLAKGGERRRALLPRLLIAAAAAIALSAIVWVFSIDGGEATLAEDTIAKLADDGPLNRPSSQTNDALPPYAALEFERERKAAQERLEEFVQLQIRLEDSMQVDTWAEAEYREAKNLAKDGDVAFQSEQFEAANVAYDQATEALAALETRGHDKFAAHIAAGKTALDQRDVVTARREFADAQLIKPDNQELADGLGRTEKLPEVIDLLRAAKNHELAYRWAEALATYDQIEQLDGETAGLDDLRADVARLRKDQQVKEHLSRGFATLDAGQYGAARTAFNAALALEPGNEVAAGGLAQVASRSDISTIGRLEQDAASAEKREQWQEAADLYDKVLALDANIQFAKLGAARARNHQRIADILEKIKASPEKLSSKQLYTQAHEVLQQAESLTPSGPSLKALTSEVRSLVTIYGQPVAVTILSDAATEVLLSSVGRLGRFANKTLELRPGEYTVIGSQDGCRDVRQNIIVRPGMKPITVRCSELITQ